MADRTLDFGSLLASRYEYAFIDEPNILKVYAQYKSTGGANGKLKLGYRFHGRPGRPVESRAVQYPRHRRSRLASRS